MVDLQESYRILGIPPGASLHDAKAAWRHRAQVFHPDHFQDAPPHEQAAAERQFKELSEAWRVVRTHLGDGSPFEPSDVGTPPAWSRGWPDGSRAQAWDGAFRRAARQPPRKTVVAAIVIALAAFSLFGYRTVSDDGKPEKYSFDRQRAILDNCESTGASLTACRCVLDDLMTAYSEDELDRTIANVGAAGEIPPDLQTIGGACR